MHRDEVAAVGDAANDPAWLFPDLAGEFGSAVRDRLPVWPYR